MRTSTHTPPEAAATDSQTSEQPSRKQQRQQKQDEKQEARQHRIDVLAQKLVRTLRSEDRTLPPEQRRSEQQLWKTARTQATKDERNNRLKQGAKDTARQAARTAAVEAKSTLHRNRKQLAPWALAAPYAALGAGGWVAAEFGSGHPVGLAAVFAATALGASILAWQKWLGQRCPKQFHQRITATMGLLTLWSTLMPLIPTGGQGGMWLALLAGVAYMALPWWRAHEHPLPAPAVLPDPASETTGQQTEPPQLSDEQQYVQQLVADYRAYVAIRDLLPGSTIADRAERTAHGFRFQLQLPRGKQTIKTVRRLAEDIGYALNVDPSAIQFDQDRRPGALQTTVLMTIITDPVSNAYDGPTIVYDGGDVSIELGPHSDGMGAEYFHVLSDQLSNEELAAGALPSGSIHGGFALGAKGSGKSRFVELLAAGFRTLGIEIWYLDPQEGASSEALSAEADWPFRGIHGTRGSYSNVVDLVKAMQAACEVREAELAANDWIGFQHTRERPAIMVIVDECHKVFQGQNPETGKQFGDEFADLDRKMRKCGIGLLGASQGITLDNFGSMSASVLRDGMCGTNAFIFKYGEGNAQILSGYEGQPSGSLPGRGFGYALQGTRPHVRFQARCPDDRQFRPYLAAYPTATLDQRTQKRIGTAYTQRFAEADSKKQENQALLDRLDATEDGSTAPSESPSAASSSTDTGPATPRPQPTGSQPDGGNVSDQLMQKLVSPAQRRDMPTQPPAGSAEPPVAESAATGEQQQVLELLRAELGHTPTTTGQALHMSRQTAGKHLRKLAEKGLARKDADGTYSAAAG